VVDALTTAAISVRIRYGNGRDDDLPGMGTALTGFGGPCFDAACLKATATERADAVSSKNCPAFRLHSQQVRGHGNLSSPTERLFSALT
jgi:hypothetical protein